MEAAIIREMESFLLELGAGFSFVARQKRIQIDGEDFHLDLLFYNRKLRRLVAVELKVGEFKAAFRDRWSFICAGWTSTNASRRKPPRWGSSFALARSASRSNCWSWTNPGIHVAEYLTALPPRGVLVERLQQATQRAQLQIEQRKTDNE